MSQKNVEDSIGYPPTNSFIYQNPLLNPTNSSRSGVAVPLGATGKEIEHKKKSQQNISGGLMQTKESEAWSEYVDHNNFIHYMLHTAEDDLQPMHTCLGSTPVASADNSFTNLDTTDNISQSDELDTETNPNFRRNISAPWKRLGSFTNQSLLQQEAFDSFKMMSPDPPNTPPEKQVRTFSNQPRLKACKKPEPNVVIGYEMKLVPDPWKKEASSFPQPQSIRLPAHSRINPTICSSSLRQAAISLNEKPPLIVQSMVTPHNKPIRVLYPPARPSIHVPTPVSKRRERFPPYNPTAHRPFYYGNGRRMKYPMPPQVSVNKIFTNESGKGRVTFAESVLAKQLKQEKIAVVQTQQNANRKNNRSNESHSKKKVPPAKMFPIHVPGPMHDNIYISEYMGSDGESAEASLYPQKSSGKVK